MYGAQTWLKDIDMGFCTDIDTFLFGNKTSFVLVINNLYLFSA